MVAGWALAIAAGCGSTAVESQVDSQEPGQAGQPLTAPTGNMAVKRLGHRSVPLTDGRILVMGGYNGSGHTPSAELYNPATNGWVSTGNMLTGRDDFTATRLADGRVLVVGGESATEVLASAELYNPATGTWSATASLPSARTGHTATLLPDGRVLVTGGVSAVGANLNSTLLYNPATGTWSTGASMLQTRVSHTATALADGRVLVAGNVGSGTTTELYDPATGTWSFTGALQQSRGHAPAIRLPDGKVLKVGGIISGGFRASAELYDPATGTWSLTGTLGVARHRPGLALLSTGDVLVLGGGNSEGDTSTVERWSAATGTWSLEYPLSVAQGFFTADVLSGDRVLVVGSSISTGAEVYTPGGTCVPTTCAAAGKNCGAFPDGCGTTLQCGTCSGGLTCQSNVCTVPATAWTATYDSVRKTPACTSYGSSCSSGTLLNGRGSLGPELNAPNTLRGSCADDSGGTYHESPSIDRLRVYSDDGSALEAGKKARVEATVWAFNFTVSNIYLEVYVAANADNPSWQYVTSHYVSGSSAQTLVTSAFTLPLGEVQAVRGVLRHGGSSSACVVGAGWTDHDDLVFRVSVAPDTVAPAVSLTAPTSGAVVRGTTVLRATASDAYGVARVDFYDGTQLLGSDSTSPYEWSWNSLSAPNGTHQLGARALDAAGNTGTATPVQVTVDNDSVAPTVTLTEPAPGAVLRGTVTLSASASDNVGVASVDFEVDGSLLARDSSAPFSVSWNTNALANGNHVVRAIARDAAGNTSAPSSVSVVLDNDKVAPLTQLTSPASGATLTGTVSLTAEASDNVGVVRVAFYVGTTLIGQSTTAPFQVSWNTTGVGNGTASLSSKAYDAAGNVGTSTAVSVTVDNPVPPGTAVYDAALRAPRCATPATSCDSGTLLNGRAHLGPEPNQPNAVNGSCTDGTSGSYHGDESLDGLRVFTQDGSTLAAGKTVTLQARVWVWGASSDWLDLYAAPNASSPVWTHVATLAPSANGAQTLSATYVLPAGTTQVIRGQFRYGGSASPCTSGGYNDVDDLVIAVQ